MTSTKTVLITGATTGIGRHAALELVRRGHHVIATGRNEEALADLRDEARGAERGRLDIVRLDVTDEDQVRRARDAVDALTSGRGLDVLVNNAGYGLMGPLEMIDGAELRKQYETNVFGLMSVTRAFLPQMRARGAGCVINIGSIGGRVTFPLMGAYSSTKHAVVSISDALRLELAPFGISVVLVEPGPIRTGFNDRAMATIDSAGVDGSPYAAVLARAHRFRERFEARAAGADVTTFAIVHAVSARRPRARYVVPSSAAIALALLTLIPSWIVDLAFRFAAGLTPKGLLAAPPSG